LFARYATFIVGILLLGAHVTGAQILSPLTEAQIAAAAKDANHKGYYQSDGAVFTTPYARVVWAAKLAAKELQVFTTPAPGDDLVGPYIEVECEPYAVGGTRYAPPDVVSPMRVVLMPKGSKDVSKAIQPLSEERVDREFKNAMGAIWNVKALKARFPIEGFTEQMEVVRVNSGSDHQFRSKIKLKNVK
jgi:hypothetical protein